MDSEDFARGAPGELVPTTTEQGTASAFDPKPLPPDSLDRGALLDPLAGAAHGLGRLQGIGPRAGSMRTLIEPFLRKEALESSQIEGTRATLSDIYTYEAGREDLLEEERREGTQEVLNYLEALDYGLSIVRDGGPIRTDLLCEMHRRLLEGVRGGEARPGEIRDSQNIIGSTPYIHDARYVPPPPDRVKDRLQELTSYVNEDNDTHPLVRIGLAHYQFEAIHPFKDGNGRLGRLLVSLLLEREGLLPEPYLYLSSYFNSRKRDYTDLLLNVSTNGEWAEWLLFFLRGVQAQADEACRRAELLMDLREEYQERYKGERSGNILSLVMRLFEQPYLDVSTAAEWIDKSYDTANRLVGRLEEDGVLSELTGKSRNRFYRAEEIFEILIS